MCKMDSRKENKKTSSEIENPNLKFKIENLRLKVAMQGECKTRVGKTFLKDIFYKMWLLITCGYRKTRYSRVSCLDSKENGNHHR